MDSTQSRTRRSRLGVRVLRALRRLTVIVALVGALVVAAWYYGFDRLDEEIRLRVETELGRKYPHLIVTIRSARRIPGEGVELRGIELRDRADPDGLLLLQVDEALAVCDTRLPDFVSRTPRIVRLDLRRPTVQAQRQADGSWNVARLIAHSAAPREPLAPRVTVTGGTIEIIDPMSEAATPLALRNIELTLQPLAESSQLRVAGTFSGDHLDRAEIDGLIDPLSTAWEVRGAVEGLEFSPRLRTALPRELAELVRPLSTVRGRTFLGFSVKRSPAAPGAAPQPLEFVVSGKISEGRIDDSRLPEPLADVEGTIRADNHGVRIDDLSARCGRTTLQFNGELFGLAERSPWRIELTAQQLDLGRVPTSELPAALARVFADFSPGGEVDLTANIESDGENLRPNVEIACRNLSLRYHRFSYPLTGGTGSIELKDDRLVVRLRMLAGSQYVQCRADVQHPGSNFRGWVEMHSEGDLPVDEALLTALEPRFQKVVRPFHPRGNISLSGRLQRGLADEEVQKTLRITMHDCSIQHDKFSYPIDKIGGTLQLTNQNWMFRNLVGRNDSAYITGEGTWRDSPTDGRHLDLEFKARDVPLADELRLALSPEVQRLWANLRPRGNIDQLTVRLGYYAADKRMAVDVTGAKWPAEQNQEGRTLSIEPSWFRYRLENLTGTIHYRDGRIDLHRLAANHGKASLTAEGTCAAIPKVGWQLQLARLTADRLESDHDLIAALPEPLGQGLSHLAISGPLNVLGTLGVLVPSDAAAKPQLEWDLTIDLENGRLATAVPVEHVHGGVRLVGEAGPQGTMSRGELAVDSAVIQGIQLTTIAGPLLLEGERLRFGIAAGQPDAQHIPRQVTAYCNSLAGTITLDGQVALAPRGEFDLVAGIDNADLAATVTHFAPRQKGLSGKVFGVVNLAGTLEGVHTWRGAGQVRLRDADIYELPAMISMLNLLSVQRPNRTAFTTSHIDFRIEGDDLTFDRIDFSGDALCLKGKGRMTGRRDLDFKFYPQLGRDETHLPIFRPLVGEASRQFMLIEVSGTLDKQQVTRTVFPQLDERLAQLFPELAVRQAEIQAERDAAGPPILTLPRQALERSGLMPKR
jgi:hypothetical protein